MNKFQVILILCGCFLTTNICKANHALLLYFEPHQAQLTPSGIIVESDTFPNACVNNIQFDEKGCYAEIEFEFACRLCGNCTISKDIACRKCGSSEVDCVPSSNTISKSMYQSHQEIFRELGNGIIQEMKRVYAKGEANDEGEASVEIGYEDEDFHTKGSVNSDGEVEVEVGYRGETEDGSVEWSGKASVKRDKDGSTAARVEVGVDF